MTQLRINTIDTAPPTNLRVGLKWDPLARDNIAELHDVESAQEARKTLAAIPGKLWKLSLLAGILRATFMFRKVAAVVDGERQYKLIERKDLERYLTQAKLHSYDLDLCCFCYDKDGKLAGFVTPDVTEMHGTSRWDPAFLHAGNDTTGIGEAFDEELLIRLPLVDAAIHQIFIVIVSVNHGFDKIKGGFCSIVSTRHERELMSSVLQTPQQHRLYVMAKITRDEKFWVAREVAEYCSPEGRENALMPRRIDQLLAARYLREGNDSHEGG